MSNVHTRLQRLIVKCSNNTEGMNVQPDSLEDYGEPVFLKRRVIPYGQREGVLQTLEKMEHDKVITRVTSRIFRAAIDGVFRGPDGVLALQYDVIVFGKTKAEHDDRRLKLFERFAPNNVSIRASRCVFSEP
ncbi:unnamed protein product [Echinostoma caproni]|uniref:Velvet domain-containing protein n=1 Tax=Echinostoma caproni TaxID=27848 RepID=A0A183BEI6_9TREM|nr:unnamed protein product [Echinostoma caproni]